MATNPTRAPVLLVPGLMAGDWTMRALSQALRDQGHPTVAARIGFNVGCTSEMVDRIEERLRDSLSRHGRRAIVVGWSRGGTLGKLATLRSPHLVSALITLGSPNANPRAVSRVVMMQLRLLSRLNALGVRQTLGADCLEGECAGAMLALLSSPFPAHVPYISFYSKSDGVVDWRACRDADAECVEVNASHFQLGFDRQVMRQVVARIVELDTPAAGAAS